MRRRTVLAYGVLGVGAYLVFLVASLPAATAYEWARAYGQVPPQFSLQGVQGTVWSGHAQHAEAGGLALGRIRWRINPWQLWRARLDLDWQLNGERHVGQGELVLRPDRTLALQGVRGTLRAEQLTPFYQNLPLRLTGDVGVQLEQLVLEPGRRFAVRGDMVWENAALTAPQAMELGSLRIESVPTDEGGSRLSLSDRGGPLNVQGTILVGPDGSYRTSLSLAARAGADAQLASALRFFGRSDGSGRVRVTQTGRIPGWPNG